MNGQTIKTLAEYIAKLHRDHASLEHPEHYVGVETDTNGVGQDRTKDISSTANTDGNIRGNL